MIPVAAGFVANSCKWFTICVHSTGWMPDPVLQPPLLPHPIMMPFELFSRFECGDMTVLFFKQDKSLAFTVMPAGMESLIPDHPTDISGTTACRGICAAHHSTQSSVTFENMVQFHVRGDEFGTGYAPGESMVNNGTVCKLEFVSQEKAGDAIRTVFRHPGHNVLATQEMVWHAGEKFLEINTTLENDGDGRLTIDMLDSFQMGMLSPFAADDGPDRYHLHRTASYWSMEGRQIDDPIEHLALERAWVAGVWRAERFGQRTSMPVKRWFPWCGFEDRGAGVTWGVQLGAIGPWQLEVNRIGDYLNMAGGLPDWEFANWSHELAPGERLKGIPAILTVVRGDAQDALNRLTHWPQRRHLGYSRNESDFPVIFNEFCTTWGAPTEEKMLKLAGTLKDRGIKYLVMDAGWFRENPGTYDGKGDWQTSLTRFPNGMKAYCDKIRALGFIPGIWFEFEQFSGDMSRLGKEHPEFAVRCHGVPHADAPMLWALDFRRPDVRAIMQKRVIDFLRDNGFGYVKVDYNYTVSGVDEPNGSTMDGIIANLNAVENFFGEMKRQVPDLTLEVCASGGHRLTPGWMRIGDMASFSDAHEDPAIPLVAAGTALQIPFRANQVWAVLHDWDDDARICYSLTAAMIGRLCVSGDVDKLSESQLERLDEAIRFYNLLKPVIAEGASRVELRLKGQSWRHPQGFQVFRRGNDDALLLVVHAFAGCDGRISIDVPEDLHIDRVFSDGTAGIRQESGMLHLDSVHDWCGIAIWMKRRLDP